MEAIEIPLERAYGPNSQVTLSAVVHLALAAYHLRVERYIEDEDGPWLAETSELFPTLQQALEAYETVCREEAQFALWEQEIGVIDE